MLNGDMRHVVHSELTLATSILGFVEELDDDAVSAFGIWSMGRYGFGLSGADLEEYIRRAIAALLDAGAVPVFCSEVSPDYFSPAEAFKGDEEEVIEKIVSAWKLQGSDPDHGWLWFYKFEQ